MKHIKIQNGSVTNGTSVERELEHTVEAPNDSRKVIFQIMIFTLTYLSYSTLHIVREGWSILKPDVEEDESPGLDWEGTTNSGLVDFFFLFSYSFGLFISGVLGDNYPIRIILPIGYLIVAAMTVLISLGGTWQITNVLYYIAFFSISGLWQSIGWPSFISVMGNWFSKDSRGLIFGLWWTCQNMGNILGNVIANLLKIQFGMSWMWNLRTIGIIIAFFGILNAFLLIDHPSQKNIAIEPSHEEAEKDDKIITSQQKSSEEDHKLDGANSDDEHIIPEQVQKNKKCLKRNDYNEMTDSDEQHAISFWDAWLIPGVIPFALWIAFVKCATYGILFWLPTYTKKELDYASIDVEFIAIAYDVGTIFGSVILGKLTDIMNKKRSPVAFFGLLIGSALFMLIVFFHDSSKYFVYVVIYFIGFFVGGIFNIVAATAAADLAKGDSLKGNDKALATVSGILDGSGSLGAAFGSLVIGAIRNASWNGVFTFLAWSVFFSSIPIFRVFLKEIKEIKNQKD